MAPAKLALLLVIIGSIIGGRSLVSDLPPRTRDLPEAASSQLLGGLRAVPLLTLWNRVQEAEREGRWFDQLALFDLISTLAPDNAALAYYRARTEALTIAADQPTPADAWNWVDRAMKRLMSSRTRLKQNPLMEEGLWDIGFYAGQRFPAQYTLEIALDNDDDALEAQARALINLLSEHPKAQAFLESNRLRLAFNEDKEFIELSEEDQQVLQLAELARWNALAAAAKRGLSLPRGISSALAFKHIIALRRAGAVVLALGLDDSSLRLVANAALYEEVKRLKQLGEAERAAKFAEQMEFLIGRWLEGLPQEDE